MPMTKMRPKDPKYRVSANSVDELSAKLVYLLKLANEEGDVEAEPRGKYDVLTCETACGSKVKVSLSREPADVNCRRGIEIDGFTLG